MKDLVLEQQQEIEKAIVGGKYKMRLPYKHLEVKDGAWRRMNEEQRKTNIRKLNRQPLKPSENVQSSLFSEPQGSVSVQQNQFVHIQLPQLK